MSMQHALAFPFRTNSRWRPLKQLHDRGHNTSAPPNDKSIFA